MNFLYLFWSVFLSYHLTEFLTNIGDIPLTDSELTGWVAMELFRRSICTTDESQEHVLHTINSEHPLASITDYEEDKGSGGGGGTSRSGKVSVPGASSLRISFDRRTRTGSGVLAFYRDEDLTSEPKTFRWEF